MVPIGNQVSESLRTISIMVRRSVDYETWTRFVKADYLVDAKTYEGKCPKCKSPNDCNNYFCLNCKLGGLCPMAFRGQGEHIHHRWLQVRRQSYQSAVDAEELANYLPLESVKHIKECSLNKRGLCYLRTDHHHQKASAGSSGSRAKRARANSHGQPSSLKSCESCRKTIANSQDCKLDFLLCSCECLIKLSQRWPERNLLRMREGALEPTNDYPPTTLEKIQGRVTGASSSGSKGSVEVKDPSRSRSSSGGENVANEEEEEPLAVAAERGSTGQRSVPVNHRVLHGGAAGVNAAGSSRAHTAAATSQGTRDGVTTEARTRGSSVGPRSARRRPASRAQAAPDYSAYPLGYQSAGLNLLVQAFQVNGGLGSASERD